MSTHFRRIAAALIPLVVVLAGCSKSTTASSTTTAPKAATTTTAAPADTSTETIVQIASADPDLSTLVSLIKQAGLADALSGPGPFTVFAPTNEAFAKVPKATLDALAADPTGKLADVLKLHVVSGKITAADAVAANGTSITTLNGGKLAVMATAGSVTVGGAHVVKADIPASNGVIHIIDTVITAPNG